QKLLHYHSCSPVYTRLNIYRRTSQIQNCQDFGNLNLGRLQILDYFIIKKSI
ncbi:unnamed protein product, partial [Larinioides sclopetarius]